MKKHKNFVNNMNHIILTLFLILGIFANYSDMRAAVGELELGFTIGATIPSDKLSSFYEQNKLSKDNLTNVGNNILATGYNFGVKLNLPLSESFEFYGSLMINRFPEKEVIVRDNNDPDVVFATLIEHNNLIPIEVGFNLNLINGNFATIYTVANLSYNLLYQSIDIKSKASQDLALPAGLTESNLDSRIGGGLGVGAKFDIKLVELALEAKFNRSNLIFKSDSEFNKDYYTFNFFVFF